MRFCPKCSLKIKGDLTQCPICKVELLSCAEDEDIISRVTGEDYQEQIATEVDSIFSTESDTQDGNQTTDLNEPVEQKAVDPSNHTDDYTDFKKRMGKLEKDLRPSHECIQNIEKDISRLSVQIDHLSADLESVKNNLKDQHNKINKLAEACTISLKISEENRGKIKNLEVDHEKTSSPLEERQSQNDLLSEKIVISEEGFEFPESKDRDSETDYESIISPLSDEGFTPPVRERKFLSPLIIISLLAALIISSWFAFHYFKSPKQNAQKEIIALKSTPAPTFNHSALDSLPKSNKIKPTQKAKINNKVLKPQELGKKPPQSKKSTPDSKVISKKQSSPLKKSKTRLAPLSKTSGYTINVGSFRDRKRAYALTKKLQGNGYPALMSLSKKDNWYKVKIGAFSTFKEARAYANNLAKKEKFPAFISKIE